jgi:transcription termination/antitermination protein NusG
MGLAMAEPQAILDMSCQENLKQDQSPQSWLAAYTRARHESVVVRQLQQKGLDTLLPMYRRLSRWSDRIRRSDTPLFPGYVFVRVTEQERRRILQTAGVVSIVCCSGTPVPLSEDDIEKLRFCTANPSAVEPHPYLRVGQRVRVKHGPFHGWEGVLVEKKNSTRLVITVDQIMKSVSIDLSGADVEPLGG